MSSFFTLPKSQKRKRPEGTATATKRLRTGGAPSKPQKGASAGDDESISGSDSDLSGDEGYESGQSGNSEDERETAAEKRLRLAEDYLESLRNEAEGEVGFDAEEIDRDIIADRLKEDVAETKGKLYRYIASSYNWSSARRTPFKPRSDAVTTAVAVHGEYVYTAAKDLTITKWRMPLTPGKGQQPSREGGQMPLRESSPHPELSKARRRKLREQRRKQNSAGQEESHKKPREFQWSDGLLRIATTKGSHRRRSDRSFQHHIGHVLCLACSPDGRYLVSGGSDKRLIVWDTEKLVSKRVFSQHRAAVTSLAFKRNSNQLFSASADRTIKVWSLDELAYVETLFGHQDEIYDVGALGLERCVSVGGRDRTARLWKVVEETQLVFRGGGSAAEKEDKKARRKGHAADAYLQERKARSAFGEGSIDRVALIDDDMFVTGSDNGSLSLWNAQKKKPVHTIPLAHGLDPALPRRKAFADIEVEDHVEVPGPPLPRWITALAALPYSDLLVSGSWDGSIRVWRVTEDKRRLESVGTVGMSFQDSAPQQTNGVSADEAGNQPNVLLHQSDNGELDRQLHTDRSKPQKGIRGIVNDLKIFERGERGKEEICIVAATGKEHRLGRWMTRSGLNGAHLIRVSKSASGL